MYEECDNFHIYSPSHSGAIVDIHFTHDGSKLVTASTDKTVGLFDTVTCQRIKRFKGHTGFVNSVSPVQSATGPPLVASASDDCSVKIWDCRRKNPSANLNSTYQVTVSVLTDFLASESCEKINNMFFLQSVAFGETPEQIISAGIDNFVKIWDLRKGRQLNVFHFSPTPYKHNLWRTPVLSPTYYLKRKWQVTIFT